MFQDTPASQVPRQPPPLRVPEPLTDFQYNELLRRTLNRSAGSPLIMPTPLSQRGPPPSGQPRRTIVLGTDVAADDDDESSMHEDVPSDRYGLAALLSAPRVVNEPSVRAAWSEMSELAASHLVSAIFLAQTVAIDREAHYALSVGSAEHRLPRAQHDVYQRVELSQPFDIVPDRNTLVATAFHPDNSEALALKCRFTFEGRRGEPLVDEPAENRVPLRVERPGADVIPWQSFNSSMHYEPPSEALPEPRQPVAFLDAGNVALGGDSFYISTQRNSNNVALLGMNGIEEMRPSEPQLVARRSLYFYDAAMAPTFNALGPRLYGNLRFMPALSECHVVVGNVRPPTLAQWDAAVALVRRLVRNDLHMTRIWHAVMGRARRVL
jgi:hypothetical protein